MTSLFEGRLGWKYRVVMVTLIGFAPPHRSTAQAAAVMSAYLAFERRRQRDKPLFLGFAGLALVSLLGGLANTVPRRESLMAALVFAVPCAVLFAAQKWRGWRLSRRLDALRASVREVNP
jgi:hypothetical protein